MSKKMEKQILFFLLPFIVFLCGALYFTNFSVSFTDVSMNNNVFEMTDFHFDSNTIARLNADPSEFVNGELLTPEEFSESDDIEIGSVSKADRVVTSRIRISVPDDNIYAFSGLSASYASKIFVNGVLLTKVGKPGKDNAGMIADEEYIFFTARPENGIIEIVQQSSNFVFTDNYNHTLWNMGLYEPVNRYVSGYTGVQMLTIGVYLLLFIAHLSLYLIRRSYSANLWLSLLCVVWIARIGVTSYKPFLTLFPSLSWEAALSIEYISIPLAIILIVAAYNTLFPNLFQKIPLYTAYALSALSIIVFILGNTLFLSQIVIIIQIFAVIMGIYLFIRFGMILRKPSSEQIIILVGLIVVLLSLILDIVYYNLDSYISIYLKGSTTGYALMVFSIFQIVAMFFGTIKEISNAREREVTLRAENDALDRANQFKTDIMHTVANELRAPLSGMMGYTQLIAQELKEKGKSKQTISDLESITAETRRLADIIDEIQGISLSSESNIESIITQTTRLFEPILLRKDTYLEVNIEKNLPQIKCSSDELTQVLFNLISNSEAHTEAGKIRINVCSINNQIELSILDTGVGIPTDLLPHIFESGVTSKEDGAGLGLTICKSIVEKHDGQIEVQSIEGQGTKVIILFPISQNE